MLPLGLRNKTEAIKILTEATEQVSVQFGEVFIEL